MREASASIRLTGNTNEALASTTKVTRSLEDMEKELKRLNVEWKKLDTGSTQFKNAQKDVAALNKEIANLNKTAGQGSKSGGLGNFIEGLTGLSAARVGALGLGAGLAYLGKEALTAADQLEGVQNRARRVFEGSFPAMKRETDALAASLRRSDDDILRFSTDIGAMLKSVGASESEMRKMGKTVASLAVDFGSYFRIADDQAFDVLRKAIMGQTKAMGELGIVMDDGTVEAYAYSKGVRRTFEEMSEAEQMAWRYQYILEQTAGIQGEATKNAGGYSDSLKQLAGTWDDLMENFGSPMLSYAAEGIQGLNTLVVALSGSMQKMAADWSSWAMMAGNLVGLDAATKSYAGPQMKGDVSFAEVQRAQVAASTTVARTPLLPKGGGASKAKKEVYDAKKAMEELGKTYSEVSFSMRQDLLALEADHSESMKGIQKDIEDTRKKQEQLEKDYKKSVASMSNDEAGAVADQIDKVKQLKRELDDLKKSAEVENITEGAVSAATNDRIAEAQRAYDKEAGSLSGYEGKAPSFTGQAAIVKATETARTIENLQRQLSQAEKGASNENAQGGTSVRTNDLIASLRQQIADKEKELQGLNSGEQGAAAKGREIASRTEFENSLKDIGAKSSEEKDAYDAKVKETQDEITLLEDKKTTEQQVFESARQQYASTTAALGSFQADYRLKMADIKLATEETVKAMNASLKELQGSITAVDAGLVSASTLGSKVAERRSARQATITVPAMAEGGVVNRPTLALIGEAGPEAVVPLNKAKAGNITLNISSITVKNDADENRLIAKLQRFLELQLQAA